MSEEQQQEVVEVKTVTRDLVINSHASEVDIALLEDNVLVELHREKTNNQFAVGDVYLGRVKKILPGLTVVDDKFGRHDVDVRQYGYLRVGPCCEQAAPKCYQNAEESSHLFSGFLSFPFAKIRRISDKSKKSSAFIWFSACLFVPLPPKYGNLVADAA